MPSANCSEVQFGDFATVGGKWFFIRGRLSSTLAAPIQMRRLNQPDQLPTACPKELYLVLQVMLYMNNTDIARTETFA
jgi:hypothetical protein